MIYYSISKKGERVEQDEDRNKSLLVPSDSSQNLSSEFFQRFRFTPPFVDVKNLLINANDQMGPSWIKEDIGYE